MRASSRNFRCAALLAVGFVLTIAAALSGSNGNKTTVTISIDGGNALVLTEGGARADVGPIKPRPRAPVQEDFIEHPMNIVLARGTLHPNFAGMQPAEAVDGESVWPIVGFDVFICPGGSCLAK